MKKRLKKIAKSNRGFGMNELIGIAAALIVAAFIIIPELINFGKSVMGKMDSWWSGISEQVFCTDMTDVYE